ncbi:SMP-30/gluconolactonase/LRE family protein [Sediminibacillus halophilus]|uniref:Regucalcin n=1 Tax=Sediminibacillus halophilus TaxID=482461 RepID=A0A1G9VAW3_9BACI|nr:SMP-30/gluconolactonase/LRE family protein [Sediminibacillus halophilus]SDM69196.1 Sugar lactone lactonase YvrE [Sediminibacillus halophilus]
MTAQATLLFDAKAELAESPYWDANRNQLYWVDINNHQLHVFSPGGGKDEAIQFDQFVSAVTMTASGNLLLAMHHGIHQWNPENEELTLITSPEENKPENRFNEGKCDPEGRFWAGTMELNAKPGAASLYRIDADHTVNKMVSDVTISNGLAWSVEKKTMYYADTPTQKIDAFDYEPTTGAISNRRTVIRIPEEQGAPDGMTIDEEGMLWIAQWGGARVGRWNPETGKCLQTIELPAAHVSSCTFGGADLDELYITTAREHLRAEQLKQQPHAGGLFWIKLDVKGAASNKFADQS